MERTGFPFNADLAVVHTLADKKIARTLRAAWVKDKQSAWRPDVAERA